MFRNIMTNDLQKPSRMYKLRSWYGRYERPVSSLSLVGGFIFDALTLKRVDLFWENFWVAGHLLIVGVCIILINVIEKNQTDDSKDSAANPSKAHFWLVNILQFFFGGILSTYLVFYFRSGDIAASWPFLLILAVCFWANESLKRHFVRLGFQIALFFLSVYCFAIFLLPVLLHKISPVIFLLSGGASLIVIILFVLLIKLAAPEQFKGGRKIIVISVLSVLAAINVLYFYNFIPPLPLSVRDAGVYYSVKKNSQGNYVVEKELNNGSHFWTLSPDFHRLASQPVYVYTAIFSPPQFSMNIIHDWQRYDATGKQWVSQSRLTLPVVGGRENGFRTYSEKLNPAAGQWRVNILTQNGQVIGRVRFNVVQVDAAPVIASEIKN